MYIYIGLEVACPALLLFSRVYIFLLLLKKKMGMYRGAIYDTLYRIIVAASSALAQSQCNKRRRKSKNGRS